MNYLTVVRANNLGGGGGGGGTYPAGLYVDKPWIVIGQSVGQLVSTFIACTF